jgi:DNA-binding winged helix-turn-helix (wHTH) protein
VSVQPQVFDLLEYLIRNRGHVVSRDDLLDAIWGGRIVSESTLATRINAARSAIGDDGESQRLIRTLSRKGIRFVGEVREVEEEEQPRARRATASPSGAVATVAARVEAERRPPDSRLVRFRRTAGSCDAARSGGIAHRN